MSYMLDPVSEYYEIMYDMLNLFKKKIKLIMTSLHFSFSSQQKIIIA